MARLDDRRLARAVVHQGNGRQGPDLNTQFRSSSSGILEAAILPQLKAFRAVSRRRVAPVLHPARLYRKMPAHLQGCRILGTQSDSPVVQTYRIQSRIGRTSGSFSSHCRSSGILRVCKKISVTGEGLVVE